MYNYTLFYKRIDHPAIQKLSCGRCGKMWEEEESTNFINHSE